MAKQMMEVDTEAGDGRICTNRGSFMDKCRQASEKAPSRPSAMRAIFNLILSSIGCTIAVSFLNIVPISMIVVGSLYFDKEEFCTAEDLQLLLIIGGSIGLLQGILEGSMNCLFGKTESNENKKAKLPPVCNSILGFLSLLMLVWFIVACVFVYRLYPHVNYEQGAATEDYCNRTLYLYSFWLVTLSFIVLVFVGAFCCCCACCLAGCLALFGAVLT